MAINLPVGTALLVPIVAMNNTTPPSPNTTAAASVGTNSPNLLVKINPNDNRELGILALAAGGPGDVNVTVGSIGIPSLQVQPTAPQLASASLGTPVVSAPPSWLA